VTLAGDRPFSCLPDGVKLEPFSGWECRFCLDINNIELSRCKTCGSGRTRKP
jgi:hypothetical protein